MNNISDNKKESTLKIRGKTYQKFAPVPNAVLTNPKVSVQAKTVLGLLLSYAWFDSNCFTGQTRLANDLGTSDRFVRKYLSELEEHGLISVERRGLTQTNIYWLEDVPQWILNDYENHSQSASHSADRNVRSAQEWNTGSVQDRNERSYKVNEDKINKEEVNKVLHKGQVASQLSQSAQPDSNTDITSSFVFDLEVKKDCLTEYPITQDQVVSSNPIYNSKAVEHNNYSDNVQNAKRLFSQGKITRCALDGWVTFLNVFEARTGKQHPRYNSEQIIRDCEVLSDWEGLDWYDSIEHWFNNTPLNINDYHFSSFATKKNLDALHFKTR